MPKIVVHEKVLGHLTRGLYRSPASALRELVSNAWDARASLVNINTHYPSFLQLSVQDDGIGFTAKEFKALMEGGIGNSNKRSGEEPEKPGGRPVIGRLGIGMLGIAQICGGFSITSRTAKDKGFKATVRLYDLLREKLDKDDPNIVKETVATNDSELGVTEVDVGEYTFEENYDPRDTPVGTLILTDRLHPVFIRSFQNSVNSQDFKAPSTDWAIAVKQTQEVHSLRELGEYWRLLWELSASVPVPYLSASALPHEIIKADQKLLKSYDFKVVVDGINLAKPLWFKGNQAGYTVVPIEHQSHMIYGRELKFHGYIAVQEGSQIRPDELRGILIRIKNVGIGYYDASLLDYRFNEGPRSRWVTGEIYVDNGLEDALNVDRDSFNRFHPQYRKLQEIVHDKLRNNVFPAVYKQIDVRSKKKSQGRDVKRQESLREVIEASLERPVELKTEKKSASISPSVKVLKSRVEVNLHSVENLKTKKSNKSLASSILTIYDVSQSLDSPEERRNMFQTLLLKLLSKW